MDDVRNTAKGLDSSQAAEQLRNIDVKSAHRSFTTQENPRGRQFKWDPEKCPSSDEMKMTSRNGKTTDYLFSDSKSNAPRNYPDGELDTPSRYDDFESNDDSEAVNSYSQRLGPGKTHMEAAKGNRTRYLNSYGPRSSAIIIWESVLAVRQSANVVKLHRNALHRMLEQYSESIPSLRRKVDQMIAVAWHPEGEIPQIQDLLVLAEELNPENKTKISKYQFPFTTVLVKWKEEFYWLSPRWLSRSEYKRLTGTGKKISANTDCEIYRIACLQLKRFNDRTNHVERARDVGV